MTSIYYETITKFSSFVLTMLLFLVFFNTIVINNLFLNKVFVISRIIKVEVQNVGVVSQS